MAQILLTKGEILLEVKFNAEQNPMLLEWLRKIAKAQLKKVMTDAPWKITTIGEERSVPNKTQIRFLSEEEYQALLREAGLEG